jgi:hypothetical protein
MLRNFHDFGAVIAEHEAESPLLVDADTVLALAISRKRLEPVARRNTQIFQAHCGIQLLQFRERAFADVRRMGAHRQFGKRRGGCLIP